MRGSSQESGESKALQGNAIFHGQAHTPQGDGLDQSQTISTFSTQGTKYLLQFFVQFFQRSGAQSQAPFHAFNPRNPFTGGQ